VPTASSTAGSTIQTVLRRTAEILEHLPLACQISGPRLLTWYLQQAYGVIAPEINWVLHWSFISGVMSSRGFEIFDENPHLANPKVTTRSLRGVFARQSTDFVRNMASRLEFPENKNNNKK
jgi:hypothetical protein